MSRKKDNDIGVNQQIDFLKKINFFHDFDDSELRQFLAVSKWLKVPKGTLIIKENTTEKAFYIIVRGEAEVCKTTGKKNKTIVLTTLASGDCFGEMALVTAIKRTADVRASTDSFILKVEPDIISTSSVFLQIKFYKRFCEIMVSRLDRANKRMASDGTPANEEKDAFADTGQESADTGPEKDKEPPAEKSHKKKVKKKKIDPAELPSPPLKEDRVIPAKLRRKIDPEQVAAVNPAVVERITDLLPEEGTSEEEENTRRFTELISLDPVLSSRVVQSANSPYFRRASEVASVPHAMIIAGMKHIQEVVEEAIETGQDVELFSGFSSLANSFWQHSVMVGKIASMLKDVIGISITTDVYLAGLLHDVGILALDAIRPDFYPQLLRPDSEYKKDLVKAEKEYIGVDHGQAGVWLGESIGLPNVFIEVMRYHHLPEKAHAHSLLVSLVHLANLFAAERGVSIQGNSNQDLMIQNSFAWVIIQEQHKPFLDVNLVEFINSFNTELDKIWDDMLGRIPLE